MRSDRCLQPDQAGTMQLGGRLAALNLRSGPRRGHVCRTATESPVGRTELVTRRRWGQHIRDGTEGDGGYVNVRRPGGSSAGTAAPGSAYFRHSRRTWIRRGRGRKTQGDRHCFANRDRPHLGTVLIIPGGCGRSLASQRTQPNSALCERNDDD
jgi:hypothetical protein